MSSFLPFYSLNDHLWIQAKIIKYCVVFFFSLASFGILLVPLHFHHDLPETDHAPPQTQWTSPLYTFRIGKYRILYFLTILGWVTFSHELITTPSAWQLNLLLNRVLPRYAIIVNAQSNLKISVKKEKT